MKLLNNKTILFVFTVLLLFIGAWSPLMVEQTVKHFTGSENYENQSFLIISVIAGTSGYIIGRIRNLHMPNAYGFILIAISFAFGFSIFLVTQILTNPNEIYKFYAIPYMTFLIISYFLIPEKGKMEIIKNYTKPQLVIRGSKK